MSYGQQLLPITVFPGCSCLQATYPCGGPQKYSSGHTVLQKAPLKHILAMPIVPGLICMSLLFMVNNLALHSVQYAPTLSQLVMFQWSMMTINQSPQSPPLGR